MNENEKLSERHTDPKSYGIDSVKFLFCQCEKHLDAVIQIAESFRARAIAILSIIAPTLLGVLVAMYKIGPVLCTMWILIISAILLLTAGYFCVKIINTRKSAYTGSVFSDNLDPEWLKYEGEDQEKELMWNECTNYDIKIKLREKENDKNGKRFERIVFLLFSLPIIPPILYLLFLLFFS